MKKDIAMKWIKALRSGKYKQTTYQLKNENGYCCLGVLCSELQLDTIKASAFGDNMALSSDTMKLAGMKHAEGRVKHKNGKTNILSVMNDQGKSFKQIANYIKKYWKIL